MFSKISGVNLLGFQPQLLSTPTQKIEPKYIQTSVAPQYSLAHPRANDSDGVVGESSLAKRLDLIS